MNIKSAAFYVALSSVVLFAAFHLSVGRVPTAESADFADEISGDTVLKDAERFLRSQESFSVEIVGSVKGDSLFTVVNLSQQIDYRSDGCVSIVSDGTQDIEIDDEGNLSFVPGKTVKAKADGKYLYMPSMVSDSYERHDSLKPLCSAENHPLAVLPASVFMEMVTGLDNDYSREFGRARYRKRERVDQCDCDVVSFTVENVNCLFWIERGERNVPHRIDFIFDEGSPSESIVSTRFRNWRFSQPLPDELFEYSPPDGFEEIRNPPSLFGPR